MIVAVMVAIAVKASLMATSINDVIEGLRKMSSCEVLKISPAGARGVPPSHAAGAGNCGGGRVPGVLCSCTLCLLVAFGLMYACVEGKGRSTPHRGHRRAGTAAAGAAGLGVVVVVGCD